MAIADAVDWKTLPSGFDSVVEDLRAMRVAADNPSYSELARRIADGRAARGVPEHERRMARSTLYDSFRSGRRRMDVDAAVEIALAIGLPERLRARWTDRIRAARSAADSASVAAASEGMPAPVPSFVGRDAELALAERALERGASLWVTGMAGAGKTQLALVAAARAAGSAGSGIFVDLRGHRAGAAPVAPAAAQRAILRLLGIEETFAGDDGTRAEQLARLLRASGRVLVLDDAADAEQVRRIVGERPASPVIVTSRAVATGAGDAWQPLPLPGLDGDETAALLRALAPSSSGAGTVTDDGAQRLAAACGGLPLAIALVGSRVSALEGWALTDHVELIERRIGEGRIDGAVSAELDLSYRQLTPAAARLLRACADVPVAEPAPAAMAALLGGSAGEAAGAADELVERNLATRGAAGGVTLHLLVRAYGRDRAEETDPPAMRRAAFARLAQHYAEHTWAAYATVVTAQGDGPRPTAFTHPSLPWSAEEASAWLHESLPALLTVAHEAPRRGCPELLLRISEGLSWWLNLAGHHVAALKLHEAAADLAAELGDADALAMASLDAGQLLVHRDRPDEALPHFTRARRLLDGVEGMRDPGLLGVLQNMSGLVSMRQGHLDEAIEALQAAVALHEGLGEDARLCSALTNLGVALHTAGRFDEEAAVLERGLGHARAKAHLLFEAHFLVSRAELRVDTGDLDGAEGDAQATLVLAERLGTPFLLASARGALAQAARHRGEHAAARTLAGGALETARSIGSELTVAEMLIIAAHADADAGLRHEALERIAELESLLAADGDHLLRGRAWQLRSQLSDDAGQRHGWRERAVDAFVRAGAEHLADALRA